MSGHRYHEALGASALLLSPYLAGRVLSAGGFGRAIVLALEMAIGIDS